MQKKILVRLPNWLGDLVMSTAFIEAVNKTFPDAIIDVITKKGIDSLLDSFPVHRKRYLFSKQQYKGLKGAWKFGKEIAAQEQYDLFFSLPNSLSAAVMGYASGAKKRIGYKNGLRNFFLTDSYTLNKHAYHVEEYIHLLKEFTGNTIAEPIVQFAPSVDNLPKKNAIIININSEAQSRRWPIEKAVSIISTLRKGLAQEIILIGSDKEKLHVDTVYNLLPDKNNITNLAGKSPLHSLIPLMRSCKVVLSSESGPAQISNAAGVPTLITLGASDELLSTPSKINNISTIRYGQLPCEPCRKNVCKKFPKPECLSRIDELLLLEKIKTLLV